MLNLEQALTMAAKAVPAGRYRHTLGVVQTAVDLARRHHVNPEPVKLAAALHDLAKGMPLGHQLALAKRWGLIRYPEDEAAPHVLHGPLAAYWLEHVAGLTDPLVLKAIAHHTLGAPGMSETEMIIYCADLVEPNRHFPGVDILRQALYDNLKTGMLMCVEHTLKYLETANLTVHPVTLMTYENLKRGTNLGTQSGAR